MKTCRNCAEKNKKTGQLFDGERLFCTICKHSNYACWRPRPWVPVLICAAIGIVLIIAVCIIWAALGHACINAIRRPEPTVYEFVFMQKKWYTQKNDIAQASIIGHDKDGHPKYRFEKIGEYIHKTDWQRGATVVWTIYSVIGSNDGYAISKGE